jgi:hypothetical protein
MALNAGLDVSFDNMYDWKKIREKAEKVNSTEAYVANYGKIPVEFSTGVTSAHLIFFFAIFHRMTYI